MQINSQLMQQKYHLKSDSELDGVFVNFGYELSFIISASVSENQERFIIRKVFGDLHF